MVFKPVRSALLAAAALTLTVTTSGCSLFSQPRDDSGTLTAAATIHINETKVGDCIAEFPESGGGISDVKAVPCATAHNAEVYAKTENSLASSKSWAEDYCTGEFASYIGIDWNSSILEATYVAPPSGSTDKTLVCIVMEPGVTDATTSLRGSAK
ncbi:MAG: septum formation family protein [Propionibacteriaceae bacterium]|jgi:hypothetical protein|nr:septum formation family protein [Propionibacteriaceae bacterium]